MSQPFAWRGLSVDIARSFFPLPVLMSLVDRLSSLDLNVLHLHLTDDQGWRLEIPGLERLTEISGATAIRGGHPGWLTVEQWTQLVRHAEQHGVTVVPEIDLPGHINAALHACPELNRSGVATPAYTGWKVGFSGLDVRLAATEPFLRHVLGEVAAMTPGPWIHIGGDECQSTPSYEYVELIRLATSIVEELGKRPIAWQEALAADLRERLTLQWWVSVDHHVGVDECTPGISPATLSAIRSRRALVRQAELGAPIILSPARFAYFDMKYEQADTFGRDWAGPISVDKAGSWDPRTVVSDLPEAAILGVEAAIWTEAIHTPSRLNAMLGPRLDAFAAVAHGGIARS
ncbi:MAG: family 20 glycosylhydrolase [Propionibacteriaceae bacterium]|jgi:hexosaminidase|nr:family 20 glycosylhydrolase [Propionibacteriaceae bacterium]